MAGTLSLLRPYKKTAHNVIDFFLFFFMGSLSSGYFLPAYIQYNSSLTNVFGLIYLPVLVLVCYLIYRFFKWLCCTVVASSCRRHQPVEEEGKAGDQQPIPPPTHTEVNLTDYAMDDLFADRMLNPTAYNTNKDQ